MLQEKALKPAQLRPRADYLEVGEESPTSTLDQQRFMAERLPDRRLVVYPGLGHSIDAIHPEGCTQQVREFVASLTIQGGNYALLHVCCRERGQQDFSRDSPDQTTFPG